MINCPFCDEEIQEKAKKCKHCGEWIEQPNQRLGGTSIERGTADARSVAKGIKQQKEEEAARGCFNYLAIGAAITIGFQVGIKVSTGLGWFVGIAILVICIVSIEKWYNRE